VTTTRVVPVAATVLTKASLDVQETDRDKHQRRRRLQNRRNMAYVTLEEVLDQAPQLKINAQSKPNTTDASKIVTMTENYVNSVLKGLGYTTPIDPTVSPKAYAMIQDIVVQGVIAKILKSMFYGVRNPEDVGANGAWREFTSRLSALSNQSDPSILEDAVGPDVAVHAVSEMDSNISYPDYGEDLWRPTRDQIF